MPDDVAFTGVLSVETAATTIQTRLMLHYETISYFLVIAAYLFSFGEYLFLRLTYFLNPGSITYHAICYKRSSEIIGKNALHYATVTVAFVSAALFQIMCFFGLTISEKWVRYRVGQATDTTTKLRKLLSQRIRNIMETTVYPTFVCYGLASVSVSLIIFYMVGIRDSLDEVASTIFLYVFDVIIVIYFFAFPLITYIYHPYVRKSAAMAMIYATGVRNLRSKGQFARQVLPFNSSASGSLNHETASQVANPAWFLPPRSARSLDEKNIRQQTTASSCENPEFLLTEKIDIPKALNRNARLTSTV